MKRRVLRFTVFGALWLHALAAGAQSGGPYVLTWSTIDGGGATFSTGGNYSVGGTAGQPDAGTVRAGGYTLAGGFWGGLVAPATPTPTVTPSATATNTVTQAPTSTATSTTAPTPTGTLAPTSLPTSTVTPAPTAAVSATATPSATQVRTQTPTPTGSPEPTPSTTPALCSGDCDGGGVVSVDELLTMVNIALGNAPVADCLAGTTNGDDHITIDEILTAVMRALNGC